MDDSRFLEGTPLIQRRSNLYSNFGLSNLMPFFSDPEKKIAIKYQLNRTVMYADVILIFSTKMEQLNYASYLQNATMFDIPMDLRSCFESYLAPELIEMISNTVGIPIYDDNDVSLIRAAKDLTTKVIITSLHTDSQDNATSAIVLSLPYSYFHLRQMIEERESIYNATLKKIDNIY